MNVFSDFFIDRFKLILLFISVFLPVLGHVSAYYYYSNFGVEYFRFSNWSSGFVFLWEHFDVVLSTSAIVGLFNFIVFIVFLVIKICNRNSSSLASTFKPITLYLCIFLSILLALFTYFYAGKYEYVSVKSRFYVPYTVVMVSGDEFSCVKPLGTIGGYLVLVGNGNRAIVKEEQVSIAYPLALQSPSLSYDLGYPSEYSEWSKFWSEKCANKGKGYNHDTFPSSNNWDLFIPIIHMIKIIIKEFF